MGALTLLPMWHGNAAPGAAHPVVGTPAALPAMDPIETTAPPVALPASDGSGSPAVYPPPSVVFRFDHARHARKGVTCARCHDAAAASLSAKDNLLPGEQVCRDCHATGDGVEQARQALPPPNLKFNHKLHLQRGMACALCHAGVEDATAPAATGGATSKAKATVAPGSATLATSGVASAHLPRMALCLGCHDGRQATARCGACHPTTPDGRLRTAFPSGLLIPSGSLRGMDAHTSSFRTQHKAAARDERYCATCHKQTECTECHGAGVIRPADFHPVDYATLHAMDARRNIPNCSSCHRNQTFCLGCHQRLGVAADTEGGRPGRQPDNPFGTGTAVKRFHPPGWVRDEAGVVLSSPTPASHSVQARRNLRVCVSCHREESCLTCHSADPTRSMGVSPHPPGFARSAACGAMARRNTRACLKCHAPGASALSCD